jgi:hypothetical protein
MFLDSFDVLMSKIFLIFFILIYFQIKKNLNHNRNTLSNTPTSFPDFWAKRSYKCVSFV